MCKKIAISLIVIVAAAAVCIASTSAAELPVDETNVGNTEEKTDQVGVKNEPKQQQQKQNKPQAGGLSPGVSDEDLEKLLMDKRYLSRQIKCALGQGACDPVGRRLKSLAPLVLRGACPKCTDTEKRQIQKTLAYIQKNYPKDWARLMATYTG